MLLRETKITRLWSLCMIVFKVTSSSGVIGSTTNQTSDDKFSVAATTKIFDALSSVVTHSGCNCGEVGECVWDDRGRKSCQCPKGYGLQDGICTKCLCYLNGADDVDCTFHNGEQKCSCPPGYEERISNICLDVTKCNEQSICPGNTKCVESEGGYKCVCDDGYKPYAEDYDPMEYGCTDINECFEENACPFRDTTECINTQGSYFCVCRIGYFKRFQGALVENEGCQEDLTGWRVGYIILVIFFIFASFILIMAIRKERFDSTV